MFRHHLFPRNMTELRIWQSFEAALPPPPPPAKLCWNRGYIYLIHTVYNNNGKGGGGGGLTTASNAYTSVLHIAKS